MKIYDCFTFFNEFELLDIRLQLLNNVVDYFVIVEADHTYKGEPKKFNFEEQAKRFDAYKEKILYIKVTDMPLPVYDEKDGWKMEFFQRNCIMRGLSNCNAKDIIILSDVDEIPNPDVILAAKKSKIKPSFRFPEYSFRKRILLYLKWFFRIKILSIGDPLGKYPLVCEQHLFYYFLNYRSRSSWNGSILTRYKNFHDPQQIRERRNRYPRIPKGGWHFSYLGGIDRVIQKLKSINEGELTDHSEEYVRSCITEGKDLYGRIGDEFTYDLISPNEIGIQNIDTLLKQYPSFFNLID